jgi:hypothetical protein
VGASPTRQPLQPEATGAVGYFNCWSHIGRLINARLVRRRSLPNANTGGNIIATPVLGGRHHIYNLAA